MRKRNFRKQTQLGLFPAPRSPSQVNKIVGGNPGGASKVDQNRPDTCLTVFCDGGCVPNPGLGGWAFVVYRDGAEIAHDVGGIENATNNVAELTALLRAVEWISEHAGALATIISDSRYVVDGCNIWRHSWRSKGWKRKSANAKPANQAVANLELWQAIDTALTENPLISVAWCKGHSGVLGNVRADDLASIGRASVDSVEVDPVLALDREYRAIMGEPAWI